MADLEHPYFPVDAVIPGYLPNSTPVAELIVTFGAIVGSVIGLTLWQTTRTAKPVRPIDKFAAAWFALCGFLHVAFEGEAKRMTPSQRQDACLLTCQGYYLVYRYQLPGMSTLFAQLWKEYTLSDSRYLTHDIFTVSVETITCVSWACFSRFTDLHSLDSSPGDPSHSSPW
ncbi:hypothetical protein FVEG_07039 [Fusarium verticillioides 7600]|uniref:EXPERA domain-containing protein n=1 Tax=Gibberella moniliformis (strain M3125 / FGSC 7600) TaxID=334819 RepID=W7MGE3_GIBM7|nr:hypothetical protein FVEG_07039 [Fusarium verticillioides 7600]EWG46625.1 hypothetical protein FVEG_07039 [Fusarium verticillioides 7600]